MSNTKTILVKVTFVIPVEVTTHPEYNAHFDIEENHCPGTGSVGVAIDEHIEKSREQGICWACQLGGENEIVTIEEGYTKEESQSTVTWDLSPGMTACIACGAVVFTPNNVVPADFISSHLGHRCRIVFNPQEIINS